MLGSDTLVTGQLLDARTHHLGQHTGMSPETITRGPDFGYPEGLSARLVQH